MGGFLLGKWIGTIVVVLGLSIGATFLYIFGNFFLKKLVRNKFLNKFQNLEIKFKKSEFIYLLIYRFIGGIPWQLSCLLPTLFNVKVINFFFATLIGIIPKKVANKKFFTLTLNNVGNRQLICHGTPPINL